MLFREIGDASFQNSYSIELLLTVASSTSITFLTIYLVSKKADCAKATFKTTDFPKNKHFSIDITK